MDDTAFIPVRGTYNEVANTPIQDGQFLFTTDGTNHIYIDVKQSDGTVRRVQFM